MQKNIGKKAKIKQIKEKTKITLLKNYKKCCKTNRNARKLSIVPIMKETSMMVITTAGTT